MNNENQNLNSKYNKSSGVENFFAMLAALIGYGGISFFFILVFDTWDNGGFLGSKGANIIPNFIEIIIYLFIAVLGFNILYRISNRNLLKTILVIITYFVFILGFFFLPFLEDYLDDKIEERKIVKLKEELKQEAESMYVEPKTGDSFYLDLDKMEFVWYEETSFTPLDPIKCKINISNKKIDEINSEFVMYQFDFDNNKILFYQDNIIKSRDIKYIYWEYDEKTYIVELGDEFDASRLYNFEKYYNGWDTPFFKSDDTYYDAKDTINKINYSRRNFSTKYDYIEDESILLYSDEKESISININENILYIKDNINNKSIPYIVLKRNVLVDDLEYTDIKNIENEIAKINILVNEEENLINYLIEYNNHTYLAQIDEEDFIQ